MRYPQGQRQCISGIDLETESCAWLNQGHRCALERFGKLLYWFKDTAGIFIVVQPVARVYICTKLGCNLSGQFSSR